MWFLTCDSGLLGDHPIWLRPGSQHLLGRTTPRGSGDQVRYIDHKSVSRKHLVIRIDEVKPGSSKHVHTRSKVSIEDASKTGTSIDGEKLLKGEKVIDKDIEFKLGSSEHVFHIIWRPVVLTFTNLPASQKKKDDPLAEYRALLEHADVKLVTTYLSNTTSHVIASGRNNPSCLQALAQAKWTVQRAWMNALAKVVAKESNKQTELEQDFGVWPLEKNYLVPAGSEPVARPDDTLLPDPKRTELFQSLTFIFMTEPQYDSLMPVVAAAGGKALLCEVIVLETRAAVFVDSIKAHFKDAKQQSRSDVLQKVAIVRAASKENSHWWTSFNNEVDSLLNRPSMDQSGFLDIILTQDLSSLRSHSAAATSDSAADRTDGRPTTQKLSVTRRFGTRSRFKGFDDLDPSQVARSPSPEAMQVEQASSTKKRPASSMSDMLDEHLQGMQTMKRQKLPTASEPSKETTSKPKQTVQKVVDVKAILAEQRKQEEERRLADEALNDQLDGLTVEDLKKLVQYAEFEVDMSVARTSTVVNDHGKDWDPAWNGRRNFKAFRKKGETVAPVRPQRIMVALEPIPATRDMFSEEYFLESNSTQTRHSNHVTIEESDDQPSPALTNGSIPISAQRKRALADARPVVPAKKARLRGITLDQDDDDELQFRRTRH